MAVGRASNVTRRGRLATCFVVLSLWSLPLAAASCEPDSSQPEVDADLVAARYYIDSDDEGCLVLPICNGAVSIWIYQESNGVDGLQRNDFVHDDTCGGRIASDTIIF